MVIGADVFRRDEIRSRDRDYSRASWTPGGSFENTKGVSISGNTLLIPTRDGSTVFAPGVQEPYIARPVGKCEGEGYTGVLTDPAGFPGTGCGYAYANIAWLDQNERSDRESLFASLDHPLGDAAELYADARIARTRTLDRWAPATQSFFFTPSETLRQTLTDDPEIAEVPDELLMLHRFEGHGNRDWSWDLEEFDLALGARGKKGVIGYDGYLRAYRIAGFETGGAFVSRSGIRQAIEEGRYNPEDPLSTDPAHRAAIRETALSSERDTLDDYRTARAAVSGTGPSLPGGAMQWEAGAEATRFRQKELFSFRDAEQRSHDPNDALGNRIYADSWIGERTSGSGFVEAWLPLGARWEVTLAARADAHDDTDATFSHQVAARYHVNDALAIRSSWNAGSKPPGLDVMHYQGAVRHGRICDTRTHTGDPDDCVTQPATWTPVGNPDLESEEVGSINAGAEATLGPVFLGADWFRVRTSDQTHLPSAQAITDLDAKGRTVPNGSRVVRDANGRITRIEHSWDNIGETDAQGIDISARAAWKTDWSDVALDAHWLRLFRHEYRVRGEKQPGHVPRDRVHASLRATKGKVTAQWTSHAISGYRNAEETGRYERWIGHDATLRWNEAFGVSGLDLMGGILNVGDRRPSIDSANPDAADLRLDSALGRTLFLSARLSSGHAPQAARAALPVE